MRKFLFAALLLLGAVTAHAQTMLVRSCPTQPTATGFGACTNSVWSVPSPTLIIDVLRQNVAQDVWITPSQLVAGDRVFACTDSTNVVGPYKSCASLLTGQTSNWLDVSRVSFGLPTTTPPPPPPVNGTITYTWIPPTKNTDGSTLTDLAGYRLYTRDQSAPAGTYRSAIVITNPGLARYVLQPVTVPTCAVLTGYTALGFEGPMSDEVCALPKLPPVTPTKLVLTIEP